MKKLLIIAASLFILAGCETYSATTTVPVDHNVRVSVGVHSGHYYDPYYHRPVIVHRHYHPRPVIVHRHYYKKKHRHYDRHDRRYDRRHDHRRDHYRDDRRRRH